MPGANILIYLLRRDLRLGDNPIFHELTKQETPAHTHLLPLYVFSAQQVEVSGFLSEDATAKSPYPEARSAIGGFWRCGPHRAKFLAESVWDLKQTLEEVGSGLGIRVGMIGDIIRDMLEGLAGGEEGETKIGGVWMANEEGVEEKREERDVRKACEEAGVEFKLFTDEKYFIDDRDLPFDDPKELPDVFTTYRKMVEPLRDAPREMLPTPTKSSLPPFPSRDSIPAQHAPFLIPSTYSDLESALVSPVLEISLPKTPQMPPDAKSAHPFHGGAKTAHVRLEHLIASSAMTGYKASRNGLLGVDFSTKLSAWLALGCITARQVHHMLLDFEDAKSQLGANADGHGKGENEGTKAVRFELLWRDYMRLCARKFGHRLFRLGGFRNDSSRAWKNPTGDPDARRTLERFLEGTTGMGLIDASQRELFLTGYTSNRARQNAASFMTKHLLLDWRLGAEWYECMLTDYDVSSNWGNWQYVAGVGNDPRGDARVFNPVKQALDYDPRAEFVKTWLPELRGIGVGVTGAESPTAAFQAWTLPEERKAALGLKGLEWVDRPLRKINFVMGPGRHGGGAGGTRGAGVGGGGARASRGGPGRGGRGWRSGGRGGSGRYGGSSRPYRGGRGGGHVRRDDAEAQAQAPASPAERDAPDAAEAATQQDDGDDGDDGGDGGDGGDDDDDYGM